MPDFATAPRLFIAPARFAPPEPLVLVGAEHHYLTRVLRLRPGDKVVLCDGQGRLGEARVVSLSGERLELGWEATTTQPEAGPRVVLLCGLLKGDKQDFVIQKATELGAHAIVQVACQRSVPQLEKERAEKRQQRWARIAQGAAQQCRRPDVPRVLGPLPLQAVLGDTPAAAAPADPSPHSAGAALTAPVAAEEPAGKAAPASLALLLYEGPAPPLHAALAGAARRGPLREVRLLIGPEGGFTDSEVAAAAAAGFIPASLGPRVLRAETAVVAALAVLQYVLAADSAL